MLKQWFFEAKGDIVVGKAVLAGTKKPTGDDDIVLKAGEAVFEILTYEDVVEAGGAMVEDDGKKPRVFLRAKKPAK